MRPPSPINFEAVRIAVITPWTLIASWRASAAVSVFPGDVLHQLIDVGRRSLVGLVGAGLDALCLQFRHHRFGLVRGGDIADGDIGAFICESPGAGRADAARAAGDEGYLA
jgi:hypothetical protein